MPDHDRRQFTLLLIGLTLPSLAALIYFDLLAGQTESIQQWAMTLGKAVQFSLPIVWWMAVRNSRPAGQGPARNGMWLGLVSGLVAALAIGGLYHGWLRKTPWLHGAEKAVNGRVAELGIVTPLAFVALGVFYVTVHSLLEEYYWRWFVFGMLRNMTRPGPAVMISSLGFAAHHVIVLARFFGWDSPLTYLFSLCVAIGGAFWAWLYHHTGRLYAPWLSHACVDAAIFWVGFGMLDFPNG